MKTCKRCSQDKPLDDFTVDTRYKDGRYPWCAECRRAWRQGRKDRQRELRQQWSEQNPERNRQQARETYHRHKDEYSARRRIYDNQRWHSDPVHRERKRQQDKDRYQNNPVARRRKIDRAIVTTHVRRARIRGLSTHYTQTEWRALCELYDHRCLCCGRQEPEIQLTPDHVTPLSRGGSNSIDNIQPLCLDCNLRKNARSTDYRPGWGS